MIKITRKEIKRHGGYLNAINHACFDYLHNLMGRSKCFRPIKELDKLDRVILHIDPHIDEYFAALLFVSSLPPKFRNIQYMETPVVSETFDVHLRKYFPNAAVFGIGSEIAGGAKPLFSFDEHVRNKRREIPSCSEVVSRFRFNNRIPRSILKVLKEINEIDASGGAHDQNIGNIIKSGHTIRLVLENQMSELDSRSDWISPFWKWTIMNVSITSIIYCLEENVTLNNDKILQENVKVSLGYFESYCKFHFHHEYQVVIDRIRQTYLAQKNVLKTAVLPKSKNISQELLLGKVTLAVKSCFGASVTQIVMMHYWEIIYHANRSYFGIYDQLKNPFEKKGQIFSNNQFGYFEKREIKQFSFIPFFRKNAPAHNTLKPWILLVEPLPSVSGSNRPLTTILRKLNHGFGFIYLWAPSQGVVLFKGSGIPSDIWRKLKQKMKQKEPSLWHDEGYEHFILNGNKTHQYVQRTTITIDDLEKMVSSIK